MQRADIVTRRSSDPFPRQETQSDCRPSDGQRWIDPQDPDPQPAQEELLFRFTVLLMSDLDRNWSYGVQCCGTVVPGLWFVAVVVLVPTLEKFWFWLRFRIQTIFSTIFQQQKIFTYKTCLYFQSWPLILVFLPFLFYLCYIRIQIRFRNRVQNRKLDAFRFWFQFR